MCKTTLFILRKKKSYSSWEPQRKYWYPLLLFFFHSPRTFIKKSTPKLFVLASFAFGLAAGNLRLMFGQFTIQERNYITAPTPFPLESGRLCCPSNSCPCLAPWSVVWCGTAPCQPRPPTLPHHLHLPHPLCPQPLRNLHCDWRKGTPGEEGTLKDTAKSRLWYNL